MSVVGELRENDPAKLLIRIDLSDEPSDADLAQALERNLFVTDIILGLKGVQRADDWNSLVRVIATRANLEKVKVLGAVSVDQRHAPAALVCSILRAIQQNTAIRNVEFVRLRLPTDLSTFLELSLIKNFWLGNCDMNPSERQQRAGSLAVALQRNTNIETLNLRRLADIYFIPIMESLRFNTSVKTFVFSSCVSFSDAAAQALQHLLESTTSIQRFELLNEVTYSEILLRAPIAQAITGSEYISELRFSEVNFLDRNSLAELQSILLNKRNLTSLCLHRCRFGGGQVHEDIISMLLRPNSLLRCFEIQSRRSSYETLEALASVFPRMQFENLVRAIKKSKLENFSIGRIETHLQLQTLTQSIPSMRIRELVVSFERQFRREHMQNFLLAVKNNFSLRSVKGEIGDEFSAEDKKTLAFYANRNECLDQWVNKPEMVEHQKLWPDALGLAEKAGPSALFSGLRSVLGRDYVSLPCGRKRKHPQYQVSS